MEKYNISDVSPLRMKMKTSRLEVLDLFKTQGSIYPCLLTYGQQYYECGQFIEPSRQFIKNGTEAISRTVSVTTIHHIG